MQTDRTKVIFKGKPVHLHSPEEISSGELHLQCSAAFGAATPSAIPPPPPHSGSYLSNPLPGGNLPLLGVLQVMYTLAKTSFPSQDPRSKARAVKAGRAPDEKVYLLSRTPLHFYVLQGTSSFVHIIPLGILKPW